MSCFNMAGFSNYIVKLFTKLKKKLKKSKRNHVYSIIAYHYQVFIPHHKNVWVVPALVPCFSHKIKEIAIGH